MQQSPNNVFTDPQSWENFIADQLISKNTIKNIIGIPSPKFIPPLHIQSPLLDIESLNEKQFVKSHIQTLESDDLPHEILFKRQPHHQNQVKNQDQSSEEKQAQNCLKRQQLKSSIYSKNYRQKKKEKTKKLEEQNQFLKKKVNELQARLQQKQLQLSRIKFALAEDEWTIQKMNKQMMKKLTLINDIPIKSVDIQNAEHKIQQNSSQNKIREFLRFYQDHGFGGRKKKQVLEYYVNEFLENVMRDREKYLIVKSVTKKYLNSQITTFDLEASEALLITNEQSRRKNIKFHEYIRPACVQLTQACRQLCQSYHKVLAKIDVIHQQTKNLAMANIEETLRRSRAAAWFQQNQYRREMRNLRAEWIDLVKNSGNFDMDDEGNKKNAGKRKKLTES